MQGISTAARPSLAIRQFYFVYHVFFAVLFALFTARVFRQADHTHWTPHPAPLSAHTPHTALSAHRSAATVPSSGSADDTAG